jgi:hypothetical protein
MYLKHLVEKILNGIFLWAIVPGKASRYEYLINE